MAFGIRYRKLKASVAFCILSYTQRCDRQRDKEGNGVLGQWGNGGTTIWSTVFPQHPNTPIPQCLPFPLCDSQSVKTTEQGGLRGYDGGKKVNGRKRHIIVDTIGLLLAIVVHAASIQDRDGARQEGV